jgi:hypothetical protein
MESYFFDLKGWLRPRRRKTTAAADTLQNRSFDRDEVARRAASFPAH